MIVILTKCLKAGRVTEAKKATRDQVASKEMIANAIKQGT